MPKKSKGHSKFKGGKTTTLGLMRGYAYLRRTLIMSENKNGSAYSDPDSWRLPYISVNYNIRTQNIFEGASVLRFGAPESDDYELYNPATCKTIRQLVTLGETTLNVVRDGDDIRVINQTPLNGDVIAPVTFNVWEYRIRMSDVLNMLGKMIPSLVWKNKTTGEEVPIWDRVLPYGDIRDDKDRVIMRVMFDA